MENSVTTPKKYQEPWKFKYFHRTMYLLIILLGLNLLWDIFASTYKSPKHFFLGILIIVCFCLFYFAVKNFKRYYTRKHSIKSKFLDSSTLVPFLYLGLLILILFFSNVSTYFSENIVNASNSKSHSVVISNENQDMNTDIDNTTESDLRNLIFFMNVSMCKYASFPLSVEHPELFRKYTKDNIINKSWVAPTRMILISFLCTFLMQVIAIYIVERLIYKLIRKKKKHAPHRKSNIATQPV